MTSLKQGVLKFWFLPQVVAAASVISGAVIEKPADYARLPRPASGQGKAKHPFAWIYFGQPAEPVQRELNGSNFETVFPFVDVAFPIPGRGDTEIDERGDEIAQAVHASIFSPFRNAPNTLPPGILDADLIDTETDPTPDGKHAVVRLSYGVLMQRSSFDVAQQTAA